MTEAKPGYGPLGYCPALYGHEAAEAEAKAEIRDLKLLTKVRKLIRQEHAGFIADGNYCIESGCSCGGGVSGPFRPVPVRCTSFEDLVLPMTVDDRYDSHVFREFEGLSDAYWEHINSGRTLKLRRCGWEDSSGRKCRREVTAPNARYCKGHALFAKRRSQREYAKKVRESKKCPSPA